MCAYCMGHIVKLRVRSRGKGCEKQYVVSISRGRGRLVSKHNITAYSICLGHSISRFLSEAG